MTITVLHDQRETEHADGAADGDDLWLDAAAVEAATGWLWKPEGLCHGDICVPLPAGSKHELVRDGCLNIAAMWHRSGQPVVHDAASRVWVLGTGGAQRGAALTTLIAPDFELPDLAGRIHRLSQYRSRKVLLVTWASWCGCRLDLPVWQSVMQDLEREGLGERFTIVAVALDHADAARPWIEAAKPTYPCLIDRDHHVADLYNLVNVPQAVWIDEAGRIVRPPETAGSTDSFRSMDRTTGVVPEAQAAERARTKALYLDAVRDWVRHGGASANALSAEQAAAKVEIPADAIAEAHARFRLGQYLVRHGKADEGRTQIARATDLHPDSWAMWRMAAAKNERGLAASAAFWERVDALGSRPYYRLAEVVEPEA
jgi:peroxiredoxin